MSLCLRLILIAASLVSAVYVIRKIRKSQMKIGDSIYWIGFIILVIILSLFPNIIIFSAEWIGVESPANLLFLVMIFISIGKIFLLSVKNSQLEYKISILTEEIAIWRNQLENTSSKNRMDERKELQ